MDEDEFNRFAKGWEKVAGIDKERVRALSDSAEKRYNLRMTKDFAVCGDYQPCKNTSVLNWYKIRQEKANRAK